MERNGARLNMKERRLLAKLATIRTRAFVGLEGSRKESLTATGRRDRATGVWSVGAGSKSAERSSMIKVVGDLFETRASLLTFLSKNSEFMAAVLGTHRRSFAAALSMTA
jgi:hypothetical protein